MLEDFTNPQTFYRTVTVNATVANNADIYFRWTFNTSNTNSQGLGLDDVSIFAGTATPVLLAQLRDILQVDNGVLFQFNEGDVIRYQTVIKNIGTGDANNVQINIPPPSNTTLVPGSIKTSALARDDNYNTNLNTQLTGQNVLANDFGIPSPTVVSFGPLNNSGATAAGATGSSDNGGTVVLNSNGTFTYTPPAGFTGVDKFIYIATTGNAPNNEAIVTINVGTAAATPVNDSYSAIGNVSIAPTAPTGILSNDPGTGLFVATVNGSAANIGVATTTTQGGNITVNSDGSFTYNPPAGFEGADNFTYTTNNGFSSGTGSATVTLNVSGMIWFINAAAAAGGNGRLSAPFNTIAAFQAVNNGAASNPATGDNIFIYENAAAYSSSAITLLQNQKLIGQDAAIPLAGAGSITGYTTFAYTATLPAMNIGAPSTNLSNTATIVTLSATGGNVVRGLTLTTSAGSAVSLSGVAANNHSLADLNINVSGTAAGINLSPTSYAGTFDYLNGTITNSGTGTAFNVVNAQGTANINAAITQTGNGVMVAVTNAGGGTINFTNTLNATNGTGLQFDNADGTYNFNGTNTMNGGDAGIDILNGSGGSFSFSSNTTITNPTGTAFNVNGTTTTVTANVTYSGSMTQNTAGQRLININTTGSGTMTFQTGTLTGGANATGVNLNAVNGNVTFSNGLVLGTGAARMTSQAITITGGTGTYGLGALSVFTSGVAGLVATNADGTINATGTIDATTGSAINIAGPAGLTSLSMTFTTVNSTGGTNNVNFTNCGGTVTINGGTLTGTAAGATFNVTGGTVGITCSGGITQAANAAMVSINGGHATGTITFQTGTLGATSGTGLQFDNADGTYNFNGPTTLNGGDAGIDILNGSGGTFTFGSGTSITNPSGTAFNLGAAAGGSGSTCSVTYNGTISKTSAGRVIEIQQKTGGTVSFTGGITGTTSNTGINLATNTGATINFTGLISLDGTASGFIATGGGTVSATNTASTIGNTTPPTTTPALNISNTTIGASGLTFRKISAGTAVGSAGNGIILDNTGATAGLTVTGTGAAATGGTIQHKTGADGNATQGIGIYLNNTRNASFSWMQLNDFDNFAIRGDVVNNFTLKESKITGVSGTNDVFDEGAIRFGTQSSSTNGLTGVALFEGNTIGGGYENNVTITENSNGVLTVTFQDGINPAIIGLNSFTFGDDGILIETQSTSSATIVINGVQFLGASGDNFQSHIGASSTQNVTFTNNTVHNGHGDVVSGGGGITLNGGGTAVTNYHLTYNISGNSFRGAKGNVINLIHLGSTVDIKGVIANNIIGVMDGVYNDNQALTGSNGGGDGIFVGNDHNAIAGTFTHAVRIEGNQIRDIKNGFGGINIRSNGNGSVGSAAITIVEATVKNNIVDEVGGDLLAGFYGIVGGSSSTNDFGKLGLDMTGNTFKAGATSGGNAIYLDVLSASSAARYYFPNYAGSQNGELGSPPGTASANLTTYLTSAPRNNVLTNGPFPNTNIPASSKVDAATVKGVLGTLFMFPVP